MQSPFNHEFLIGLRLNSKFQPSVYDGMLAFALACIALHGLSERELDSLIPKDNRSFYTTTFDLSLFREKVIHWPDKLNALSYRTSGG